MKVIHGMEYFRALEAEKESVIKQLSDLKENLDHGTQHRVSGLEAYKALRRKRDALITKIDNIGSYECILEFLVVRNKITKKKYFINVSEELARTKLEGEGFIILTYKVLDYKVT